MSTEHSPETIRALTEFCRNEQALRAFQDEIVEHRKPLLETRASVLQGLQAELEAADVPCYRLSGEKSQFARLRTTNQTGGLTEALIRSSIMSIKCSQMVGDEGNAGKRAAVTLEERLHNAVMHNIRERRTVRKQSVELSDVFPKEYKDRVDEILQAPHKVAKLAASLQTTRNKLSQLQEDNKVRTAEFKSKQDSYVKLVLGFLSNAQTTSQRLNLTDANGVPGVYFVRRKFSRKKPPLTVTHVKNTVTDAVSAVFTTSHPLEVDTVETRLVALANEVIARLDDGRTEVVEEKVSLDRGRKRPIQGTVDDVDALEATGGYAVKYQEYEAAE